MVYAENIRKLNAIVNTSELVSYQKIEEKGTLEYGVVRQVSAKEKALSNGKYGRTNRRIEVNLRSNAVP